MLKQGFNQSEIAQLMGRHRSTISCGLFYRKSCSIHSTKLSDT